MADKTPRLSGLTDQLPVHFVLRGDPVPYISQWDKTDWERRKAYQAWAKDTREFSGYFVRDLVADEERPKYVHTRAFFRNRRHGDPENIRKAVVDALFYEGKNRQGKRSSARDKYVGGACAVSYYDPDDPRIEIVIADGRLPLRDAIPAEW